MPTDAILATARQYYQTDQTVPVVLEPIQRGASGRTIVRVRAEGHTSVIGIHATDERDDNKQFVPIARFLKKARIQVPELIHDNPSRHSCLVEDLGDTHLLDLKDQPFADRLPLYRSALEQIDRLFFSRPPADLELMPPFDTALYQWEQEYFFEYLVEGLLEMNADDLRDDPAFADLAGKLGSSARHLVHRDFQSQNIIIKDGTAYLLDFQGLRRGAPGVRPRLADPRPLPRPLGGRARATARPVGGHFGGPAGEFTFQCLRKPTTDAGARRLRQHHQQSRR